MHSRLISRSAGSICSSCFIKLSARLVSLPTYFFCRVSGRDISGNLRPTKRGLRMNKSFCSCVRGPSTRWMM